MQIMIPRSLESVLFKRLENYPAVALLGARQVGKSTLAKSVAASRSNAIYLDLELNSDRTKIEADPELFLRLNSDKLICLDEIQRLPEIFSTLRSYIDKSGVKAQFLILGSASRDLINQSSESLAGRIAFLDVTPFNRWEISGIVLQELHWLRGGYPGSILKSEEDESFEWRRNYIRTFLERDIPQLGFSIPAKSMERLWTMLAHNHGQCVNYSSLGNSLGVSHHTVKSYIDILEQTYIIRTLKPYASNLGKRLVKSPKVYMRDTGLLHALLGIEKMNDLLGHPVVGTSFESYCIENICNLLPRWTPSFYRDSTGNETDLVLERAGKKIAIDIKSSSAPKPEKGFWRSVDFLQPDEVWIIGQVDSIFPGPNGSRVSDLAGFIRSLESR